MREKVEEIKRYKIFNDMLIDFNLNIVPYSEKHQHEAYFLLLQSFFAGRDTRMHRKAALSFGIGAF